MSLSPTALLVFLWHPSLWVLFGLGIPSIWGYNLLGPVAGNWLKEKGWRTGGAIFVPFRREFFVHVMEGWREGTTVSSLWVWANLRMWFVVAQLAVIGAIAVSNIEIG